MGTIKDGKDGKDGKDDCGRLASIAALDPTAGGLIKDLNVDRMFVRVQIDHQDGLDPDESKRSDAYWRSAKMHGLVDSTLTSPTKTILVLSVVNEQEARRVVEADPAVSSGAVKLSSLSPI